MANRPRNGRRLWGRGSGSQARPLTAPAWRPDPGPRARVWLGWAAAAGGIAVVAFIIGRAGAEAGLPSPTPLPSNPGPLPIAFGTALDPVTGEATSLTERFRAGDPFAYSVRLDAAPGVDSILVEIVRFEDGTEVVAQQPSAQGIVPTSRVVAFRVETSDLLTAWGAGSYAMRVYLGGAEPVAVGRFTLVETPSES